MHGVIILKPGATVDRTVTSSPCTANSPVFINSPATSSQPTTVLGICSRVWSPGCKWGAPVHVYGPSAEVCPKPSFASSFSHTNGHSSLSMRVPAGRPVVASAPSASKGRLAVELPRLGLTGFITSALTERSGPHAGVSRESNGFASNLPRVHGWRK